MKTQINSWLPQFPVKYAVIHQADTPDKLELEQVVCIKPFSPHVDLPCDNPNQIATIETIDYWSNTRYYNYEDGKGQEEDNTVIHPDSLSEIKSSMTVGYHSWPNRVWMCEHSTDVIDESVA